LLPDYNIYPINLNKKILKTLLRYCFAFISILAFENVSANAKTSSAVGTDATLKSIALSSATTLVYTTGPSDYNYTTSVSPNTPTLSVQPIVNDPAATVTVNGTPAASGQYTTPITLNGIVTTTINIVVTASDGVTTRTYTITVFETGSNNAFLGALSISTGNALVSSATGPGDFNYNTSVAVGTSSLTVTPTTADATAKVYVNNTLITSGTASSSVSLNPANGATTTIMVKVVAQDGTTILNYAIIVTEAGSNNALLSTLTLKSFIVGTPTKSYNNTLVSTTGLSDFNYTASVKSGVSYVQITPTSADGTAAITVNGVAVASGSPSAQISTFPATIFLVVTAQDGTQKTYSVTVSANANPGAACSFVLNTNSLITINGNNWTTDIDPSISSLTITPTLMLPGSAGATITINGVTATSGVASNPIILTGNPMTIPVVVTSQDGLTITPYNIIVNRNGSNNTSTRISLSTNTSLVFVSSSTNPNTTNYKTSIPHGITSITLTPTTADANATVTVNGTMVTSGTASGPLLIDQTTNATTTITMVVTAQDGTQNTTNIAVSTNGSNNAGLSKIALSASSQLVFVSQATNVTNYTTSVSSGLDTLSVAPTAADPSATITYSVNGVDAGSITSGHWSGLITLNPVGSTTLVTITVKSPDGTVTTTTNITISRKGSNNAALSTFSLSTGTSFTSVSGQYNVNYASIVSPHTISVTFTGTTSDANATFTVNGLATVSGTPSNPITLSNGSTLILIQVTAQDGVTTKTYSITVTRSGTLYVWTGATNSSFNNSGNWNPVKVPTASDAVSFGETVYTGSQPSSISKSNSVGEIYFGSATPTTLTVAPNFPLTVITSLTVNPGAVAALISSSTSYANVNIAAGATVNIGAGGQLIINSSSTPVKFTLQSNAAGSASVGQITTNSIVGTVSVQRYITGGSVVYRGYRLLSSPVYQATVSGNNIYSLNYIQSVSLVTGVTGSLGGFNRLGNPSIYLYREDEAPSSNILAVGNYWGISVLNNAPVYNYYLNGGNAIYNIPVGNGFDFYFRGDNTTNLAAKYLSGTVAESVTMTATGTLNAGPITVHDWFTPTSGNLSFTNNPAIANGSVQGFNLVGNPYASNIDWDKYNTSTPTSGIYAPNVSGIIYVLDPISKNYGVYIANSGIPGTNNASHIIASGQGFFALATASGASLTFNEDAKTTAQLTGPQLLLGTPVTASANQYMRLKLKQDSLVADEILIGFNSSADSKFKINEDAPQKPGFGAASLSSISSDGMPLSINSLKLPTQTETIALNISATSDGAYQLSMPELKSIPALFDIWLMDGYKKDSIDIKKNPAYSFNIIKSDSASFGSKRFSVVIRQNPALGLHLLNFAANKVSSGAEVVWKTVNEANYTNFTVERSTNDGKTFDVLGGLLSSDQGTYSLNDKAPAIGANQYRLKLEDYDGNITYSKVVTLLYSDLSKGLTNNLNVYPNPATSIINLTIAQNSSSGSQTLHLNQTNNTALYDIKIINISGSVIKSTTSSSPNWADNVSNLAPGTYIIQVVNSNDKSVVGRSTFIKL
jgi:hypothetical protein